MPTARKSAKSFFSAAPAIDRRYQWFVHGMLFLSGGIALTYEVLWLRRFTTVFGATTLATAATLAAVFIGLTAGSAFLGARSARSAKPLRVYALLEIGIGLTALIVGWLLAAYDKFYPALYSGLSDSAASFAAVKLLLTVIALFLPAFCMGGTLPVLAQAVALTGGRAGVIGSGLYAANTLGAAAGALSVPFFWLPQFGATISYGVCVALNLLIGVAAWVLDRRQPARTLQPPPAPAVTRDQHRSVLASSLPAWSLAALAGLSGALMFILEVTWTRMFAQVHENSLYSFAVVVAVFIFGLSGAAVMVRAGLSQGWEARRVIGRIWIGGGAAVFVSPYVFLWLTNGLSALPQKGGWPLYAWHLLWLGSASLLAPTLLGGMVLPLLMELAGRRDAESPGKSLGRLLAWNTAGVVVGSLLAACVFPKWLGLWATIAGVAVLMATVGELCCSKLASLNFRRLAVFGLILASFVFWNPTKLPRVQVREGAGEKLISLEEGNHGIVAVVEQPGSRRIKLDNFYTLGGTAATGDERMQAHVPLLLHPAPERVAFLGLGTGITAGAALLHPVKHVTAVEIVPEVVSAANTWFAEANLGLVGSPRAEIVIGDARDFLRGSSRKFDVIIGDLVVPWRRGEAALYSAEHFAAVRRALDTGGLFCQWIPLFQLSEDEFRIVVATFLDVFPRATLWRGDFAPEAPALAIIGHAEESALIDPVAVAARVLELKPDETNPHLAHEAGLWMFLVGAIDFRESEFAAARRNRENRPWLELLAPLARPASRRTERSVFVGRILQRWLEEHATRPLSGSALERLSTVHLQWRDAGAQMAAASLLLSEGRRAEANSTLNAAVENLPPEIRRAFVPEEPAPSGAR